MPVRKSSLDAMGCDNAAGAPRERQQASRTQGEATYGDDMTDDRIAELLGWPAGRPHRDSSLMHRIRLIVAEAQAEQDGHIYRLREQIGRDTAQIERMQAALVEARRVILADRTALVACFAAPGCEDDMAPEDERALAEYDKALRMIDEAMGETE